MNGFVFSVIFYEMKPYHSVSLLIVLFGMQSHERVVTRRRDDVLPHYS